MGYSQSWLAIRGKSAEAVRETLELRVTAAREEIPESPVSAVELPSGWYLIVVNRYEGRLLDDGVVEPLSRGCEVVTCTMEEHVMCSRSCGWRDCARLWSITHEAEQGVWHLDATGEPPPVYVTIRDRLLAKQRASGEADFVFDIPVELAKSLTGFRYDEEIAGLEGEIFEVLELRPREQPGMSWLKRLMGRE